MNATLPPPSQTVTQAGPAAPASASPKPKVITAQPRPLNPRKPRIFLQWTIGNSDSTAAADRLIGWDIPKQGLRQFVEKYMLPAWGLGADGQWVHNPFGTQPGRPMSLTQKFEAQEAGLTYLDEWPAMLDTVLRAGTAASLMRPVVMYFGCPDLTRPEMRFAYAAPTPAQRADRLMMLALGHSPVSTAGCLEPFAITAGVCIGLDSLVDFSDQAYLSLAATLGNNCVCEGWPRRNASFLLNLPRVVTSEEWQWMAHQLADRAAGNATEYDIADDKVAAATPDQIRGDRFVLVNQQTVTPGVPDQPLWYTDAYPAATQILPVNPDGTGGGWMRPFVRTWLDAGWSVAIPGFDFVRQGINVRTWAGLDAPATTAAPHA